LHDIREDMLHHEDLTVGSPHLLAVTTASEEEMLGFRREYDPLPPPAEDEVSASPLHVCAMMMRAFCDGFLNRIASLGAPGVDEVTWSLPVRPGDVLGLRHRIVEKRDLASRPDVGLSKMVVELVDGRDEVAAGWITNQLVRRRHPASARATSHRIARAPLVSLWDDAAPAGVPSFDVFFEDARLGAKTAFGRHAFAEAEIIAFARRFDPQPFHTDPASAKGSLFAGLCASGWHTAAAAAHAAATARLLCNAAARERGLALPVLAPAAAWRDLRWPRPVYVGDVVDFRARLSEKAAHPVRRDVGRVVTEVQGRNQRGEIVLAFVAHSLSPRREPLPS
jgi:acyl dehydratase